jgi:lysophospholipase L1-like esterase
MAEVDTLTEIPLDEAPPLDGWLDMTPVSKGFDVLAKPDEVALVAHMEEPLENLGFHFDADGAEALGKALIESAQQAREA